MRAMKDAVKHNRAGARFELQLDQGLARCDYRLLGSELVLHHTEVPAALQGQGVAAVVVQAALDWAREQGLHVRPTCSYVAAYMRRHPDTQSLLEGPLGAR